MDRPKLTALPAPTNTLTPARNFTLSPEDRLRAFVQGVPGHIRRPRGIQHLVDKLERLATSQVDPAASAEVVDGLAALNALIDQHNRYCPIEARLPIDVRTRTLIDRGAAWRPPPPVTLEALAAGRR